ncbi:MAG TPA: hypothetical protein DIT95_16020 [Arenibacter sp.]|nr:hypothetical protein [Arenibacter sp.]
MAIHLQIIIYDCLVLIWAALYLQGPKNIKKYGLSKYQYVMGRLYITIAFLGHTASMSKNCISPVKINI